MKTLATHFEKDDLLEKFAGNSNQNLVDLWFQTPSIWLSEENDRPTVEKIFTDDLISKKLLQKIVELRATVIISKGKEPIENGKNIFIFSEEGSPFSVVLRKIHSHVTEMYFFEN